MAASPIVFSTLFASPLSGKLGEWDKAVYADYEEAHRIYLGQLRLYHQLTNSKPDYFRLILNTKDLRHHMDDWESPEKKNLPGRIDSVNGGRGRHPLDR